MKKNVSFLALLLSVFILHMNTNSVSAQTKTVVMFGNSITNHGKWEEILGRTDVLNWGIPGYTTGQLIWTIKNVLQDHPGTKIWFLEGGINDITLGVPVNRIFENYKIIVDSLKRNHIIPVVQSTIHVVGNNQEDKEKNRIVSKLNKLVKKYCMENNIEYIDLNAFLSVNEELKKELSTDGCHLKPEAYTPWGVAVKKVLKNYNL